jgi:hypothetical protein
MKGRPESADFSSGRNGPSSGGTYASRRSYRADLADHRAHSGRSARLLRFVRRELCSRRNDHRHCRGGPAQLRRRESEGFLPFAVPQQLGHERAKAAGSCGPSSNEPWRQRRGQYHACRIPGDSSAKPWSPRTAAWRVSTHRTSRTSWGASVSRKMARGVLDRGGHELSRGRCGARSAMGAEGFVEPVEHALFPGFADLRRGKSARVTTLTGVLPCAVRTARR